MHHPFTQPARGNQKRRSRPEFQNTTRSRRKQKNASKAASQAQDVPYPAHETPKMQPCTYPKFQATETPTPDGTNSKPARSPPSPALHQDKEKWNLPNCRPNFLIGSKTIFDQKFFDLDLLSNKKQTKMTTRSAHQRNTILVLKFFFTKTTKTTDLYKGFDHLYKASNTSTRQQNSAM